MRAVLVVLALLPALAACRGSEPAGEAARSGATAAAKAVATTSASASASTTPAQGRTVKVENNFFTFSYAYPAAAGAIPALKAWFDADADRQQAELAGEAREAEADAKQNGYPWHSYDLEWDWQVVTELPDWLSLSGTVYSYEGGAHPNHGFDALLWDKRADNRVDALSLFVSKQALAKALTEPFCAELDRQRAAKRGEPVDRDSGDEFSRCNDPTDSAVILGSADRQHFTRIGILIGPYEAGPYVEGDYEVTLPVTAAVLQAVKPEYRRFFAIAR